MATTQSIPDFYAGREVFVTGATGFMGKVLVEKLLRSCPDIKTIFLLMRAKKGMTPEQRIEKITQLPLYEPLRKQNPAAARKLVPIYGDVMEKRLGISDEDLDRLLNVSVIFHAAASVRFDDPLRDAVLMNTRGTQQVMELALKMKNIKVVLHVSTTYCNSDRLVVDEKLYPAHADWRKTLEIVEKIDSHTLSILCNKFIGKLPNTYTFAKSLAEHVVKDYQHLLPVVIFRPSIVISSWMEPIKGWIDNFNGPVGIFAGSGKGILRSLYGDKNTVQDFMPVDVAIKGAIIAAWQRGVQESPPEELPIYNCSSSAVKYVTMGQMLEIGQKIGLEYPLNDMLWYIGMSLTNCKALHFIKVILFHLLPALLIDSILKLTGNKPMLIRLQRRIYVANNALSYFIAKTWSFKNKKFMALEDKLLVKDKEAFTYDFSNADIYEYFLTCISGGRQYLMKEDPETIPSAKKHQQKMYYVDRITKAIFLFLFCYIIYKTGIVQHIFNSASDILNH